jgi:adenosine deaminase
LAPKLFFFVIKINFISIFKRHMKLSAKLQILSEAANVNRQQQAAQIAIQGKYLEYGYQKFSHKPCLKLYVCVLDQCFR